MTRWTLRAGAFGFGLLAAVGASALEIVPMPLPPGPIDPAPIKLYPRVPPAFLLNPALNGQLVTSTNTLTLGGTTTKPNAPFSYIFGSSPSSNPAIGLDFHGGGPIAYTYNLPFEVSYEAPVKVLPDSTFKVDPFLELAGTPSLKGVQDISFGTDFFFDLFVDMPWPIPNIDVDVDVPIPNVSFQGVTLTAEGYRPDVTTTGSTVGDHMTEPYGYLTVETDETQVDAWAVSADLIALASKLGVPGMGLVNSLGFDLDLALGMPIQRQDALLFFDFDFEDITVDVPASAAPDTKMRFDIATTLTYDLVFQSRYDYAGSLSLEFDGPFFDPVTLFDANLGDFDVGYVNTWLYDLTIPVNLSVEVQIGNPQTCRAGPLPGTLYCFDPNPAPLAAPHYATLIPEEALWGATTSTEEVAFMVEASPEFVALYEEAAVPEPSTLLLLGAGLLGLGRVVRRRR